MDPKKDQVIRVRVDATTYSDVVERARKSRRTMSDYIRILIEDHCGEKNSKVADEVIGHKEQIDESNPWD